MRDDAGCERASAPRAGCSRHAPPRRRPAAGRRHFPPPAPPAGAARPSDAAGRSAALLGTLPRHGRPRARAVPASGPVARRGPPAAAAAAGSRRWRGRSLGPYDGALRLAIHELKYTRPATAWRRASLASLASPEQRQRLLRGADAAGAGAAASAPAARARLQPVRTAGARARRHGQAAASARAAPLRRDRCRRPASVPRPGAATSPAHSRCCGRSARRTAWCWSTTCSRPARQRSRLRSRRCAPRVPLRSGS